MQRKADVWVWKVRIVWVCWVQVWTPSLGYVLRLSSSSLIKREICVFRSVRRTYVVLCSTLGMEARIDCHVPGGTRPTTWLYKFCQDINFKFHESWLCTTIRGVGTQMLLKSYNCPTYSSVVFFPALSAHRVPFLASDKVEISLHVLVVLLVPALNWITRIILKHLLFSLWKAHVVRLWVRFNNHLLESTHRQLHLSG